MLTVYTRRTSKCPKKDNPAWRRCRCWKWIMGTVPGRPGSLRVSAKTRSWEQAESLARKYEITAEGGDEIKEARTLPTVKEAVKGYLADAEARPWHQPRSKNSNTSSESNSSHSPTSTESSSCAM